jgi:two-component system chemotaxis response regulator CheV
MSNLIRSVDERTQLAGANRLEILLFSLGETQNSNGREETFGINVFKVREVMNVPPITQAPDMPPGVRGMISLRGSMIPVVDLAHFCDLQATEEPKILIVTEYNRYSQGFLVHSVEQILRMDWSDIKVPPPMMANRHGGLVTAVTELKDKRIVMVLDVEKVLAETMPATDEDALFENMGAAKINATVLFADDSSVARKQIARTLDQLGITHISTRNGVEAWERLKEIAVRAEALGKPVNEFINAILTDIEMPEMDGYVLTKHIKSDARFRDIPVIMHSSLSATANITIGKSIGADAYVGKFDPRELSSTFLKVLDVDENILTILPSKQA